jgi:hypothetical protein
LRHPPRHPARRPARRPRPVCKGGDPRLPRHQDRRRGGVDQRVSRRTPRSPARQRCRRAASLTT